MVFAWLDWFSGCLWGCGKLGLVYCKSALLLRQTAFRAETFAKPTTDGASAARRHLGKPVMLCLINHLAASCAIPF